MVQVLLRFPYLLLDFDLIRLTHTLGTYRDSWLLETGRLWLTGSLNLLQSYGGRRSFKETWLGCGGSEAHTAGHREPGFAPGALCSP